MYCPSTSWCKKKHAPDPSSLLFKAKPNRSPPIMTLHMNTFAWNGKWECQSHWNMHNALVFDGRNLYPLTNSNPNASPTQAHFIRNDSCIFHFIEGSIYNSVFCSHKLRSFHTKLSALFALPLILGSIIHHLLSNQRMAKWLNILTLPYKQNKRHFSLVAMGKQIGVIKPCRSSNIQQKSSWIWSTPYDIGM